MPSDPLALARSHFIGEWLIPTPAVCDGLIAFFNARPERMSGLIGDGMGNKREDRSVKDSVDMGIDSAYPDPALQAYMSCLADAVRNYIALYPACNMYSPWRIVEPVNIQRYPPGGGYKIFHTERNTPHSPVNNRHLVFMTYLNDVYEGGGTEFLNQKLVVSARKGVTLIWPADWTHTHRGIVAPREEKYVITGWFSYVPESAPNDGAAGARG